MVSFASSNVSATARAERAKTVRRRSHAAGLRTVASLEALKGVAALTLAYVISRAIKHDYDFEDLAERIFGFFHISISHHWSQHVLNWADKISDWHPTTILAVAAAYTSLRFLEAYGLWRQRIWAEWLAIISGCIYLPLEIYKLFHHPNAFHWAILLINIVVVLYIAWVRWDEIKAARATKQAQAYP